MFEMQDQMFVQYMKFLYESEQDEKVRLEKAAKACKDYFIGLDFKKLQGK